MTPRLADWLGAAFWLAVFALLPAAVAWHDAPGTLMRTASGRVGSAAPVRPPTPPPPVEPLEILRVDRDSARVINTSIPFSTLPNPAAAPFRFAGPADDLARATDCLAAAQYYEAGDDAVGQQAVAQVILNRLRHPAFPKTVCGVVFQGSERRTGCQFTFTCDGALTRTPSAAAWERARTIAAQALSGKVYRKVGYATHYHTDWVVPYWSSSLDKVTAVQTHLFFRWTGWWGTPSAFHRTVSSTEPMIGQIARLSPAHVAPEGVGTPPPALGLTAPVTLALEPQRAITADMLGKRVGGARLIAIEPGVNAFILLLDANAPSDDYPAIATTFCAGRPRCRILAWSEAAQAPKGFPLAPGSLSSMTFSYIHDAASGLQRALWNCARTPRSTKSECMRVRDPTSAPPVAATLKPRPPETVVIQRPDNAPRALTPP